MEVPLPHLQISKVSLSHQCSKLLFSDIVLFRLTFGGLFEWGPRAEWSNHGKLGEKNSWGYKANITTAGISIHGMRQETLMGFELYVAYCMWLRKLCLQDGKPSEKPYQIANLWEILHNRFSCKNQTWTKHRGHDTTPNTPCQHPWAPGMYCIPATCPLLVVLLGLLVVAILPSSTRPRISGNCTRQRMFLYRVAALLGS